MSPELLDRVHAVLSNPRHPDRLSVLAEVQRHRRRATPLLFQALGVDASGVRIYRIGTAEKYRDVTLLHPMMWALYRLAAGESLPLSMITAAKAARQAARNQLIAAREEVARHCPDLGAALVFAISGQHGRVSLEPCGRIIQTA